MTEMEIDYAGQIVEWALGNNQIPEFVSQTQLVANFWLDKLPETDYSESMRCDGDSMPLTEWDFKGEMPNV